MTESGASGALTVSDLSRANFNDYITVEGHGSGLLYAVHDDFNDGYPSRTLILVTSEHGDTDEWTFTDSDPAGYPETMGLPVVIAPWPDASGSSPS